MSDTSNRPVSEKTLDELIEESRPYGYGDSHYNFYKAEFDRRQTKAIVEAATAQKYAAWWQFLAMVAMFLAVLATLIVPFLK